MGDGGFARAWATFLECGLLPVPVEPAGKRPLIKWGRWQHEPPAERELADLARRFPGADIAVLLNAPPPYVQILDLDFDSGSLPPWAECSTMFRSPRGAHTLFIKPKMDLSYRRLPGVEVRLKGIVVVPPTVGRTWVLGLDQLKEPPPEVLRLLVAAPSQQASLPERAPQVHEAAPQRVIEFFRADEPWWRLVASFLGLPSKLFCSARCPLHPPDEHPSGWLVVDRKGLVVFLCFHLQRVYTLPEVYARTRLRGPSLVMWALRLVRDAGLIRVDVPPPPPLQDQAAAKVLAGFLELLFLRSWPKEPSPTDVLPFTARFALSWCGLPEQQVRRSLDLLLHQRWLAVERGVRFRLYRPGLRLLQHLRVLEGCA
jgi:hypothetical protein